jgi:hypothetical protein
MSWNIDEAPYPGPSEHERPGSIHLTPLKPYTQRKYVDGTYRINMLISQNDWDDCFADMLAYDANTGRLLGVVGSISYMTDTESHWVEIVVSKPS